MLLQKTRHTFCSLCFGKWLSRLNSFDADALLAQCFLTYGVNVERSTIQHERARVSCFATQDNGKCKPTSYNSSSILYNKSEVSWSENVVGDRRKSVTMHEI